MQLAAIASTSVNKFTKRTNINTRKKKLFSNKIYAKIFNYNKTESFSYNSELCSPHYGTVSYFIHAYKTVILAGRDGLVVKFLQSLQCDRGSSPTSLTANALTHTHVR